MLFWHNQRVPFGKRLHNDFHQQRLGGSSKTFPGVPRDPLAEGENASTLAAFYGESHLPSGHLLHTAKMAMKIVDLPCKNGDCLYSYVNLPEGIDDFVFKRFEDADC